MNAKVSHKILKITYFCILARFYDPLKMTYPVLEGERYFSWTARNLFRREAYELGITLDSCVVFLETFPVSQVPKIDVRS